MLYCPGTYCSCPLLLIPGCRTSSSVLRCTGRFRRLGVNSPSTQASVTFIRRGSALPVHHHVLLLSPVPFFRPSSFPRPFFHVRSPVIALSAVSSSYVPTLLNCFPSPSLWVCPPLLLLGRLCPSIVVGRTLPRFSPSRYEGLTPTFLFRPSLDWFSSVDC